MPDVIVRGMEMPERCIDCLVISQCKNARPLQHRPEDCPLAPVSEWISADKPPTKDGEYLALMKGYVRLYRYIMQYDTQNADWYIYDPDYGDDKSRLHFSDDVLAWCEMPEVPE